MDSRILPTACGVCSSIYVYNHIYVNYSLSLEDSPFGEAPHNTNHDSLMNRNHTDWDWNKWHGILNAPAKHGQKSNRTAFKKGRDDVTEFELQKPVRMVGMCVLQQSSNRTWRKSHLRHT